MVEEPDKSNGRSTLDPYQRRRVLERRIENDTSAEFGKALARGQVLQDLRELFGLGSTYEYVDDLLRGLGYKRQTRQGMIEDAVGSRIPRDTRTEEEKEEARIGLKALRGKR